jgi:putative salt-induced outer membrane protein
MSRSLPNLHICFILLIFTALFSDRGQAQPSADALGTGKPGLHGEGGLGLIINSGNSENENLSASLKMTYTSDPWQHQLSLDARQTTVDDTTTSKRTLFNGKTSYTFSHHVYTFGALRDDRDRFSGFEYRSSASIGLGWHILNSEVNRLDLDIGAGSNANKLRESGETERNTITRFGAQFTSQLTATTLFRQELLIESSRLSTASESRTGLRVAMNSKLALQLLYAVKKNSEPPAGTVPIDRHTSVSLIYAF